MIIRSTFKSPETIREVENELTAMDTPWEEICKARDVISKFVKYEEYIMVEFDTEAGTAKVIPLPKN